MEFRKANINDLDKILEFIYAIAEYEKMTDQVVASKESLKEWIFDKGIAEVSFVLEDSLFSSLFVQSESSHRHLLSYI